MVKGTLAAALRGFTLLAFGSGLWLASQARAQPAPSQPTSPARPTATAAPSAIPSGTAPPMASSSPSAAPSASPSAAPGAAPPEDDKLPIAKDLFRRGVVLLNAGDTERALDLFLQSRDVVASAKNITNAAICLDRLGRYDEALEMYEEALTKFGAQLDEDDKAGTVSAMATLRQKVARVEVTANVPSTLVIDGRERGRLPLSSAVRVLGGHHVVRVVKDGYGTFESAIDVKVGELAHLDATLHPLAEAGQLRVEDPTAAGADVFIDRVRVGTVPWEGTLGPGKHVVWTRKGDSGSSPTMAVVVQGQTAIVRLRSTTLGPSLRVKLDPPSAAFALDGVDMGSGDWEGRLPVGNHRLEAVEAGYFAKTATITASDPGGAPQLMTIRLEIDPNHPRWPKSAAGHFWVEVLGAFAMGSSLGGDASAACPASCTGDRSFLGGLAGIRAGYRFPLGISIDLTGAYLQVGSSFSRRIDARFPGDAGPYTAIYTLHDKQRLSAPFLALGASYRLGLGARFGLVGRAQLGVAITSSTDPVTGTAATDGASVPATVAKPNASAQAATLFVLPEVTAEYRIGDFHVGAGLSLGIFVTEGPKLDRGDLSVPRVGCSDATPGAIGCAPGSAVIASEKAFGTFLAWLPQLRAGYTF